MTAYSRPVAPSHRGPLLLAIALTLALLGILFCATPAGSETVLSETEPQTGRSRVLTGALQGAASALG